MSYDKVLHITKTFEGDTEISSGGIFTYVRTNSNPYPPEDMEEYEDMCHHRLIF